MVARKKRVTFKFKAPKEAQEVKLCGSFTNWEQGAIVMKKGKTGEWKAQVSLLPGEYEYKFLADGVWYADPAATRQAFNSFGTQNSVRVVE